MLPHICFCFETEFRPWFTAILFCDTHTHKRVRDPCRGLPPPTHCVPHPTSNQSSGAMALKRSHHARCVCGHISLMYWGNVTATRDWYFPPPLIFN